MSSEPTTKRTCTVTITETDEGVTVEGGFHTGPLKEASLAQILGLEAVIAINSKMIEYREQANAETTH